MEYPTISGLSSTKDFVSTFGGYNHNLQISDGELYDMKNLCSDLYPALSTRKRRGLYGTPAAATGMIEKDNLCYVDGKYFVMDDYPYDLGLNDEEKQLVSMGAYVIILPDKKYFNTANPKDYGDIEAGFDTPGDVKLELCDIEGEILNVTYSQNTEPESASNLDIWVDTSGTTHVVYQYSSSSSTWVTVPSTYIRITATGLGKAFNQYDGVRISGFTGDLEELNSSFVIWAKGDDWIVITGLIDETTTISDTINVYRRMPDMDFVVESENRLWGCRYGLQDGEIVNELYACKLGDFRNWECYMGVSTDSYTVSLGTDGQFTGAISYLSHPIFFKETCMHLVYGNYPANFQVQATNCRGVEKGSSRSLALVNEVLYYKGRNGICVYDGSLPTEISTVLGDVIYSDAVGGSWQNKYYVSMADSSGDRSLFVYDTQRQVWHKEDDLNPMCFCNARNKLYFIDRDTGYIWYMTGESEDSAISWKAESGVLGLESIDIKYFSKISLRVSMATGSTMEISMEYDSSGTWEPVAKVQARTLGVVNIPIRPRRCDHMRIKLEGTGNIIVYSMTKSIAYGADKTLSHGVDIYQPGY